MGYEAASLLIRLIKEQSEDNIHVTLPTQLMVRHSCRALT
jgi:DNA-binding LacI/PurR family transcriptional regulator